MWTLLRKLYLYTKTTKITLYNKHVHSIDIKYFLNYIIRFQNVIRVKFQLNDDMYHRFVKPHQKENEANV